MGCPSREGLPVPEHPGLQKLPCISDQGTCLLAGCERAWVWEDGPVLGCVYSAGPE